MPTAPASGPMPEGKMIPIGKEEMFVLECGDPAGKPLVLLHGGGPGGNGWTDFGMVVPFFKDRRIVMPDLLGWGLSSKTPHDEPTWTRQEWHLDQLFGMLGVENADFACSSQGGTATLALAALYPSRVGKAVVSGCQPTFDVPGKQPEDGNVSRGLVNALFEGDGPDLEKSRALMAGLEWYDPTRIPDETVELRLKQTLMPDLISAWRTPGARGQRQDLTEELKMITAPVLFYWGKYDPFLPLEYAIHLTRLVQNSDVYIMDKASHHGEEEWPADYSRIIKAFFDREAFG